MRSRSWQTKKIFRSQDQASLGWAVKLRMLLLGIFAVLACCLRFISCAANPAGRRPNKLSHLDVYDVRNLSRAYFANLEGFTVYDANRLERLIAEIGNPGHNYMYVDLVADIIALGNLEYLETVYNLIDFGNDLFDVEEMIELYRNERFAILDFLLMQNFDTERFIAGVLLNIDAFQCPKWLPGLANYVAARNPKFAERKYELFNQAVMALINMDIEPEEEDQCCGYVKQLVELGAYITDDICARFRVAYPDYAVLIQELENGQIPEFKQPEE